MGAIYRAVCLKNGKVYVGQTTNASWEKRYEYAIVRAKWKKENGRLLQLFEHALLKYGMDGFQFRDLMTNVPNEMLDPLEKFFIRQYRSNERAFGYNVESGGLRGKCVTEESVRKIQIANRIPHRRRWIHPDRGEQFLSVSEIVEIDKATTSSGLQKVVSGNVRSHAGWMCLEPMRKLRVKFRAAHVWEHQKHGRFIGTTAALCRAFPDQRLSRQSLSYVANPRYAPKAHKGWAWVRRATDEEEIECCTSRNL